MYQPPIPQQQFYQPQQVYQQPSSAVYQGLQYQPQLSRRPTGLAYQNLPNGPELTPINYQNNGFSGAVFNGK